MSYLLYLALFALAVPTLFLLLETLAALGPLPPAPAGEGARTVAVLVPAHDEERTLSATLASLQPQLGPADRLLVVADNCTDATAAVARAAGAAVVERRDLARRGKSYALAAGVAALAADPPELVIVVDADCRVEPGALAALRIAGRERPAQAVYVMQTPPHAGDAMRLAEALFAVRNVARPLGLSRLGLPCLLFGSGMALPWSCLSRVRLDSGSVVEDVQLAIDLALAGHPPRFCPAARVVSDLPGSAEAAALQRARWTFGTLRTLAWVPRLLRAGLRQPPLLGLALELWVPPLALLFPLWALLCVGALLQALLGDGAAPLWLALGGTATASLAVGLGWWRVSRVPGRVLWTAPRQLLTAAVQALRALFRRRQDWNRTRRD